MTTSDLPAEGQPDVSTEGTDAPFDDVITLSTSTGEDGVVTVTSTAPFPAGVVAVIVVSLSISVVPVLAGTFVNRTVSVPVAVPRGSMLIV